MAKTRKVTKKVTPVPAEQGRVSVSMGIALDYGVAKFDLHTSQPMHPGETTRQAIARLHMELTEVFDDQAVDTIKHLREVRKEAAARDRSA